MATRTWLRLFEFVTITVLVITLDVQVLSWHFAILCAGCVVLSTVAERRGYLNAVKDFGRR